MVTIFTISKSKMGTWKTGFSHGCRCNPKYSVVFIFWQNLWYARGSLWECSFYGHLSSGFLYSINFSFKNFFTCSKKG